MEKQAFRLALIAGIAAFTLLQDRDGVLAQARINGAPAPQVVSIRQDPESTDGRWQKAKATEAQQHLTVAELIGEEVASSAGDSIGEIDDIVQMNGEVLAIIGVGGIFGFGEKDVAVPVTELGWKDDRVTAPGYTALQLESMDSFDSEFSKSLSQDEKVRLGRS